MRQISNVVVQTTGKNPSDEFLRAFIASMEKHKKEMIWYNKT